MHLKGAEEGRLEFLAILKIKLYKNKMKIINLFAAPGVGKTTTGQILAGLLSLKGYKVQYIPEFAKFATLSKNEAALSDQIYMFSKQENRLSVLKNTEVDFVIMDGPLPIALLYTPDNYFKSYFDLVWEVFNSYNNINYRLLRNNSLQYDKFGRKESEEESKILDTRLKELLDSKNIFYEDFYVTKKLPFDLFEKITKTSYIELFN